MLHGQVIFVPFSFIFKIKSIVLISLLKSSCTHSKLMYFLQFVSRMNPQQTLQELLSENGVFWLDLLQKYFNDDLVTVIGSPSIQLQAKLVKFYYYKYFIDSHYKEKYN